MIQKDSLVKGTDFNSNIIQGKVEYVVGFGTVAIVRVGEDRLETTECYIENLEEVVK